MARLSASTAARQPGANIVFGTEALRAHWARLDRGMLVAARRAVSETTRDAEKALERATAAAGLGRLSRAWTSKVYPQKGLSADPVGSIFPKGGKRTRGSIAAFAKGARITGGYGQFLAIPLPAAGSRGRGRNLTPGEWERRTGQRLRFVYRRGRPSLLVADGAVNMRSGRFRAATARRVEQGRHATVPIFVLMPLVDVRQRFSVGRTVAPFKGRLTQRFKALAREAIAAAERG